MALQTRVYSQGSNTFTLELTLVENSTNIAGNSSSVSYTLKLKSTTKDFYQSGVGATVTLDGNLVAVRDRYNSPQLGIGTYSEIVLLTGTTTIPHALNGSKTMSLSYTLDMVSLSYTPGPMYGSGTMTLTSIPREAKITSAPNFTDEDNPTIQYSNPGGLPIYAYIEVREPLSRPIAERKISGSSYTFNFTEAERNSLRAINTSSNTQSVRFVVRTDMGGYPSYTWLDRTLTIKNPKPTLIPTVVDSNSKTIALTGSNSKLVKYYSNAKITFGASAIKGASITSKKVTCGNKSLTSDGTINAIESGTFSFSVRDSRGNTTTKSVSKTMVNYVRLSCNIGSGVPDGNGDFTFVVSGSFFNGSFGSVTNSLVVKYRYREDGGTYSEYQEMSVSKSGNSYTASVDMTGLDYKKTYQFQAQAIDKLSTVTTSEKTIKSTPVFDWSETDFNFNVPVYINGNLQVSGLLKVDGMKFGKNQVLWEGAWWPNEKQTVKLSQRISSQPHGIVLAFSSYDPVKKVANNWDWNFHFVPKAFVDGTQIGWSHFSVFYMNENGTYATTKSFDTDDTWLRGRQFNDDVITNGLITLSNNLQVLRYVIGV